MKAKNIKKYKKKCKIKIEEEDVDPSHSKVSVERHHKHFANL